MPFTSRHVRDKWTRHFLSVIPPNDEGLRMCSLCGIEHVDTSVDYLHDDAVNIDHKIPTADGGTDEASNLQLTGRKCNLKKNRGEASDIIKKIPGIR